MKRGNPTNKSGTNLARESAANAASESTVRIRRENPASESSKRISERIDERISERIQQENQQENPSGKKICVRTHRLRPDAPGALDALDATWQRTYPSQRKTHRQCEYGRSSPGHRAFGRSLPGHRAFGRSLPGRRASGRSSVGQSASGRSWHGIYLPDGAWQGISFWRFASRWRLGWVATVMRIVLGGIQEHATKFHSH